MMLIFLRIADFFYSVFIRIGHSLSITAQTWRQILNNGMYVYGTPKILTSNPFYDFITSLGGSSFSSIFYYDNDTNTIYVIWQVMTAPVQLIGNLASVLETVLGNLGLAPLPLNFDVATLPMWVGILIGAMFWGGILFVIKFLVKAMLK